MMALRFLYAVLFVLLAGAGEGWAQSVDFPPPDTPLVVQALRASAPIALDGVLDEADWQRITPVAGADFFRMEPQQGGKLSHYTWFGVLFDDKYLYVGVFCADSLGREGIRVQDFRRDFVYGQNDIFYFQLDPQNLRRYCVSFQTTPLGTQRDVQVFDDSYRDNDWDALWAVRSQVRADGWTAEFAIPFKSLRYELPAEGKGAGWGFTAARLAMRTYEQAVFPAIPQSFSPYRMTYAARLEGLELPKPALSLRVNPYALCNAVSEDGGAAVISPKVGADAKWAINAHAVLDLTLNTDFAQADVDRAVNNLTRFNILFPERRQFFLENSGIFPTGGEEIYPYFSRSIGLGQQFNAAAQPIDLGLRYNERNERRTVSGLYVAQRGGAGAGRTHFGLARLQRNYGKQSSAGTLLTYRLDEAQDSLPRRQNLTLTTDGLIRPSESWTVEYMLSASYDEASGLPGHAGHLYAGRNRNRSYWGWVSKWVSPAYLPGMGFTFGQDVIKHNPGGYYIWRARSERAWLRRADPGLFVNYYHNVSDGRFQSADLYLFPIYCFFRDNSFFEYAIYPTWQYINFDFAPLNLPVGRGRYFYTRQRAVYRSDASRRLSGSLAAEWGRFYDGRLLTLSSGLRIAPSPHLALSVEHELNRARGIGPDKRSRDVQLLSVGLRAALNPRLQGSFFYQYNSLDQRSRWNARLSWEFQPLSFVFIVLNESFSQPRQAQGAVQAAIVKLSYMRQL